MKKIFALAVTVVCAVMAQAADYPYLVFTNTAGTTTALSVSNMTLTVSGSNLLVTNADGTTTFVLTELANMQFSADGSTVSAIDHVIDAGQPVRVFSITGASLGTFNSLPECAKALSAGAYIIKQGSNTQTIVVK